MLLLVLAALHALLIPASSLTTFQLRCLNDHNALRSLHDAPPLQWSQPLANSAQRWAEHLSEIDQLKHAPPTNFGENLFYMYGGNPKRACDRAVKNWYAEIKNYDFGNPKFDRSTALFTQLVWKGTTDVGIGFAHSPTGNFYLVARYSPPGNLVQDSMEKNVKAPSINKSGVNIDQLMHSASPAQPTTQLVPEPAKPAVATPAEPQQKPFFNDDSKPDEAANQPNPSNNTSSDDMLYDDYEDNSSNMTLPQVEAQDSQEQDNGEDLGGENPIALLADDFESDQQPIIDPPFDFPVPIVGKDFAVSLNIKDEKFTDELSFPQTQQFIDLKSKVLTAINVLYDGNEEFREAQILSFRKGDPVTADIGFIFLKNSSHNLDLLSNSIKSGHISTLKVGNSFVEIESLPDDVLKINLPQQPNANMNDETCPGYCSNTCFPGCESTCCSVMADMGQQTPPVSFGAQETPSYTSESMPQPYAVTDTGTGAPVGGDYGQCSPWCQEYCAPSCNPQCCRRSDSRVTPMQMGRKYGGYGGNGLPGGQGRQFPQPNHKPSGFKSSHKLNSLQAYQQAYYRKNGAFMKAALAKKYSDKNVFPSKTVSTYTPPYTGNPTQYYQNYYNYYKKPTNVYSQPGNYRNLDVFKKMKNKKKAYLIMKAKAAKMFAQQKLRRKAMIYTRLRQYYKLRNQRWSKRKSVLHLHHSRSAKKKSIPTKRRHRKKVRSKSI